MLTLAVELTSIIAVALIRWAWFAGCELRLGVVTASPSTNSNGQLMFTTLSKDHQRDFLIYSRELSGKHLILRDAQASRLGQPFGC